MAKPNTVTEYISSAPKESKKMLRELRAILKKAAPKAKEGLKWGAPVFIDERILFAYTAHKSHINFMPLGSTMKPFKKELKNFKTGSDTISFPYDKPLPKALIKKIAAYRVKRVKEGALWMPR